LSRVFVNQIAAGLFSAIFLTDGINARLVSFGQCRQSKIRWSLI
jgi:hypothetical protein